MSKNVLDTATIELLWTNSNPDANFAPQTISLDFSKYTHVLVVARYLAASDSHYGTATKTSSIVPINERGILLQPLWYSTVRSFKASNSSIEFGNAATYATYGSSSLSVRNESCIPYKIYGIKSSLGGGA